MTDILKTAVGGLTDASARIARATNIIVNASSTPQNSTEISTENLPTDTISVSGDAGEPHDLTSAIVSIKSDSVAYGADAAVIKVKKHLDDVLLDILA